MGEIADMITDGTMCACGEFIDEGRDGPGFMQYCSPQCERDYGMPTHEFGDVKISNQRRIECDFQMDVGYCDRKFRTVAAMEQHKQDKHGSESDQ